MWKSIACKGGEHDECSDFCIVIDCCCRCHHKDGCDCFGCRIRTVSFGKVPGGYQDKHG